MTRLKGTRGGTLAEAQRYPRLKETPTKRGLLTFCSLRVILSATRSTDAYRLSSESSTRTTPLRMVVMVTSTFCCLEVCGGWGQAEAVSVNRSMVEHV
jgi:hypothetical protein